MGQVHPRYERLVDPSESSPLLPQSSPSDQIGSSLLIEDQDGYDPRSRLNRGAAVVLSTNQDLHNILDFLSGCKFTIYAAAKDVRAEDTHRMYVAYIKRSVEKNELAIFFLLDCSGFEPDEIWHAVQQMFRACTEEASYLAVYCFVYQTSILPKISLDFNQIPRSIHVFFVRNLDIFEQIKQILSIESYLYTSITDIIRIASYQITGELVSVSSPGTLLLFPLCQVATG